MADAHDKRRLRMAAYVAGGFVAGILAVLFGLFALMRYEFGREPPPARYPQPQSIAEANRQDLEYLRHLPGYDRSFSPEAKAAFGSYLDEVTARSDGLDRPALEMAVARAAALADNAHTNALGVSEGRNLNALPIKMVQFHAGMHIVMAKRAHADLLGARVISENGQSIDALRSALRPYLGGPDQFLRERLPNFLQSPQALHAAGLGPSPTDVTFELALPDGQQITRTLTADPLPVSAYAWADRALSPARPRELAQPAQWLHVLDGRAQLPAYLERTDAAYWHMFMEDIPALYIQINTMRDGGTPPLEAYIANLLHEVESRRPRHVIVDFRFNGGGNYMLYADFSRKLPQLLPPDGKLFIVVGPNTFSAAITTLARLKHFAGDQAMIVGEPVGDRDAFWGEINRFQLPNSQIAVQYATGYHDWVNGCTSWTRCYWFNFNFMLGVAAGPLTPTLPAPLSFDDYRAGVDPALRAIATHVNLPR
jgi:hypothetical protein